jgi:sugar fermentation stimulation protein A
MQPQVIMPFLGPHVTATFLNRPQRFLAKMEFPDGKNVTAYCSNPGSLKGCLEYGSEVILWDSCNFKRKLRYTWRAIKCRGTFVGTDTHIVNNIVELLISNKLFPSLQDAYKIQREVKTGNIRADFVFECNKSSCIVEAKSVTVAEDGIARFPDSVTPRGLKQLLELEKKIAEGYRSILIFVVQRNDVIGFAVTKLFDPSYYNAYVKATAAGVETIAVSVSVGYDGIRSPIFLPLLNDPF